MILIFVVQNLFCKIEKKYELTGARHSQTQTEFTFEIIGWGHFILSSVGFFAILLSSDFFGRTILLQNPNKRSPPQYCWTTNHNIGPGDPNQQNALGQSKPRGQRVLVLGRSLPTGTSRRAPAGCSESPCFLPHRRRPSRPSLLVFRRPPALATDAEANEIVSGEIVVTVGGVNNECPPVRKPWASESSN